MAELTVRGGCAHDCPDSCAWIATVRDGVAVRLRGDPSHPFTRGALCAKVSRYLDRVYSPDRLLHPLRRVGRKGEGRFERVGWDEALAGIAERLQAVVAESGGEAVLPYSFAGNMGLTQYRGLDRRFFGRLGASRLARTVCGGTATAGLQVTLGYGPGALPEQLRHSCHIVLWGTNTIVTNPHLWPVIREARAAGARLAVIDPLRTRTALEADWHLRPIPGSDAALALGLMHVIVAGGLHDQDYVDRYCTGFEQLRARLADYPPERTARLTGVEPADLVRLARELATIQPSAIRTVLGMEKHPGGAAAYRAIACLPALTGAWRHLGGGLVPDTRPVITAALDVDAVSMSRLQRPTRTVNMIQLGRALTNPSLDPPVRTLFVYDANPAVTAPNSELVVRGLCREDLFTVVHELFLTDTARYADYVLPATSGLEHLDLLYPWGHTYVVLNRPAIAPVGESVSNNELFRRLATAVGFEEPYLQDSDETLVRAALGSGHPYMDGISFERLWEEGWAPLSIDPAWRPYAEGGFLTASGRCELYSEGEARSGRDPLPGHVHPAPDGAHPLVLVSAKTALHFLNSSYAHLRRHAAAERGPVVEIHPDDAASRGIGDGEAVAVHNQRGRVEVQARVGDFVRPGVVAMPFGWWRSAGNPGPNALTSDGLSDLGGGGDFYSTRVQVSPL
jgi:anaerobic selenocysteine-containing dehydrogenase